MKKYIKYIGLVILSTIFFSCNKENFNYPDGYVGISKITVFPTITVSGASYIYIAKGGTYTEPGVTAKAGSSTVNVVTTGAPDTNTAGVYTITYSATNADGFSASASRTVVVYSTDVTAVNNDFSGSYARTTNGSVAVWTKVAPGVYSVFNPGGAPGTNLTVIVFNQTGYSVKIPSQIAGGAPTSSALETSTPGTTPGTLDRYSMEIVNPGYGTAVRTFVKQ